VAWAGVPSTVAKPQVYGLVVALCALEVMLGRDLVTAAQDLERSQEELRSNERRFRTLVQRSFDVITVITRDMQISYTSPSMEDLLGYTPAELLGTSGVELIHPDDRELVARTLGTVLDRPEATVCLEFRLRHKNGTFRRVEFHIRNFLDDPTISGIVINQRDVTEQRMWEERLAHQASHDPLTGLPNRVLFLDELARACRAATPGALCGVLFLDLDRFKAVNDTLGHSVGDGVLRAFAGRLQAALPDASCIARFAGDEFTVLVEQLGHLDELAAAAATVAAVLVDPLVVNGRRIQIGASVGTAWSEGRPDGDADALLRTADARMYEAKRVSGLDVAIV
jgi:diguanylate cyclase (GGDEF)-like protein/PAS domain S-box-containing protein